MVLGTTKRSDGRAADCVRPINITLDFLMHAASSVLFELGNTKVICAVTLQTGVPPFLRNKRTGWLNAEYALLPAATHVRTAREIVQQKRSGRSLEISRLLSRTLRTVVDLTVFSDLTVTVDCDVIQADGGTRVAALTGAYCALVLAQQRWLQERIITAPFLVDSIAAVSVGVYQETVLLDPNYAEDAMLEADFNFFVTGSGNLVEIQGGAERAPISWIVFDKVRYIALKGISDIFLTLNNTLQCSRQIDVDSGSSALSPMFNLKSRLLPST